MLACATGSRRKTTHADACRTLHARRRRPRGRFLEEPHQRRHAAPARSCARDAGVEARRDAMFAGEIVNPTEGRRCTPALRDRSASAVPCTDQRRAREDGDLRARRAAARTGYTGKRIRHVINIGIGGSDLGPKMVVHAAPRRDARHHHALRVERRRRRSRARARAGRSGGNARDHRVEDVHDARDDDERTLLRDWFVARGCPRTRSRSTSSACRRTRPKS